MSLLPSSGSSIESKQNGELQILPSFVSSTVSRAVASPLIRSRSSVTSSERFASDRGDPVFETETYRFGAVSSEAVGDGFSVGLVAPLILDAPRRGLYSLRV